MKLEEYIQLNFLWITDYLWWLVSVLAPTRQQCQQWRLHFYCHVSCLRRFEEKFNCYICSSKSPCFVKARFNCLPTGNFLAEVATCDSLAWAIICSLRVLAFSLDPAHIFVNTFPSVIPNSKLITISNDVLPKHLSWNSTRTQRAVNEFSIPRVKWQREKKGDHERIA